ncbi:hypothetical protein PE067_10470 [Paracoccus sp. DMF-8]|uniref:hypothetical protein n=1 Tax=Paracoccus sp. DMF-8 TaxID=3019445 RepID=UPI0023E81DB6|nr:hypothetical protein [Paracoccus sp. DMF-8]MDF3606524.1 hypothetical protein [Paracoccus sp. DMF-8]
MAVLLPFLATAEIFGNLVTSAKRIEKLAKQLPIAPWVASVRGLGWGSVAAIVGEAGDLSQYPSVAGVWKRLGLAVFDGSRQRKCADAELALMHGYNPERRSVVWNMADSLAQAATDLVGRQRRRDGEESRRSLWRISGSREGPPDRKRMHADGRRKSRQAAHEQTNPPRHDCRMEACGQPDR